MSIISTLETQVLEGGALQVQVSFYDETGDPVVPSTLEYSLYNNDEEIINEKEDITLSPASSISVWIKGDDCPEGRNYFVLTGTYASADGVLGIPIKAYAIYTPERLPGL